MVGNSPDVDLAILDMNMPGMNGLQGLDILRARYPDLPVVMLSGVATGLDVRQALARGASGFIPKDLSGEGMLRALELVLSGEVYIPSMILTESGGEAAASPQQAESFANDNPLSKLTRRESEVLSLLIKGQSNKTIAQQLGMKDITAAFHLKGIFRKLGVSNRTEAVITAMRLGWTA